MSTGGRKFIQKMIYDDEAEEDNAFDGEHDSDAEQEGSEDGRDGNVNEDDAMEEEALLSDWEQTARGSSDVEGGGEEVSTEKQKPKSPKKNTTPLQTRSRAAKQALPTKELDTTGHATSRSDKAARIRTSSTKSPKGSKSVQKTLNVRNVKKTTNTSQGELTVPADDYHRLRTMLDQSGNAEVKADEMDVDKPIRGRPPKGVAGKSGTSSSGKAASPSKGFGFCEVLFRIFGLIFYSSRRTPVKRKQSTSGEEHISPPSTPAGTKKLTPSKPSDSKPSPKKAKITLEEEVVLQTEDVKQITRTYEIRDRSFSKS
ncbi:hypothetical protein B0H11DRAFT_1912917 [Mycena galericulata]|nr:hypothetical protein B0H11DRAFT_1944633 [Mycena galericulata]KAJ7488771.1 hypothetical protein B0H11DRAFT_1912917 [Mycena galericulata]